ncbi:MAG: hypothetical protein ACYT04_75050, partial [Nostoc sp.]
VEFLGMGNGQEVTCLAHALCPKGWGEQPRPPTLGMEFPAAFNKKPSKPLESVESVGTMTLEVKRNPTRPARTATLTLRYHTITIAPPQNRPKTEQLAPITL